MDFNTLLHVAKRNSENTKNEGKYYSTKFAPPKKVSKEKKLSDNIQRFLQKQEQDERERQRKEKEKVASLLAMRDEKSKNKIRKMLKVTKSANKSVLSDSDGAQIAIPAQGPDELGQDDYGYVSTEANAFYQKYMEKVKDVKEDKGFAPSRPQSLRDLSGTKERVKAAITKEVEEMKMPSSTRIARTNTPSSSATVSRSYASSKPLYDPEAERREEERKKREEDQKRAKNRRPPPPPMDFQALLKLAEKKQHEPIEIQPEVKKKKEPERLLTLKEKKEIEDRQRAKDARDNRKRASINGIIEEHKTSTAGSRMEPNGRIPKLNSSVAAKPMSDNVSNKAVRAPSSAGSTASSIKKPTVTTPIKSAPSLNAKLPATATTTKSTSLNARPSPAGPKSAAGASSSSSALTNNKQSSSSASQTKTPYSGPTREFPPRDIKSIKSRQFPPPDVQKTRQFPPADERRGASRAGKPSQAPKRRIIDDDDEDEYDSELDDFIDDGDEEEDYSSHIKAIFGYDKAKYRHIDEDDDDAAMESNFAQVQREEYISKKIGIQEDLEDMKMEAIEKKRKNMMKKRKLH